MQILPAIPRPKLNRNSSKHKDKQYFQIGQQVNFVYVGWEEGPIVGIKKYKLLGRVWWIRYRVDWSIHDRFYTQWRLVCWEKRYNKAHGIQEAKVKKPSTHFSEVEGKY